MKRAFILCVTFSLLLFAGCSKNKENDDTWKVEVEPIGEEPKEQATGEETSETEDHYIGIYNDYDNNEPNLKIQRDADGTYRIYIGIFRLVSLEDVVGWVTEDGIEFTATAPDGNPLSGTITLEGDIATVTFTSEEWSVYASVNEYRYYKTSDMPKSGQDEAGTDGQILEQSFTTELDGFGRVIFAPFEPISYPSENPDYGTTMFGDVRLMLLSASTGEKIYEFPGETEDNILEGLNQFTQVLSVAFRDYNDDGRMDILLLLEYEDSSGQTFRKARAYTQDEGETEFRVDRSLSKYLGDYTESMDRIFEGISGYWKKAVDPFGETSEWDMERFAKRVRKQILEGDYESLAKECAYPIWIDEESYEDEEALLASGLLQNLPQSFVDVIREETCEDIFHNWRGYMLGNGEVWFEELLNMDLDHMDFSSKGIKIIGFNFILKSYGSVSVTEETSGSLTEEEKLLNERMEYYRKSTYYPEIIDYWENVRGVTDVSNRIDPLYDSDRLYLTREMLTDEPPVVIHLAKNEIYARHGYIFKDPALYNYFMGCVWYTPTTAPEDFSEDVFNDYEKENLKLLAELDTM